MSAESHLFCQLTRDLPIYFTFQMNCSLFCHSGILFCNLFCGAWQVENEPWFSPVSHVNCQVHGSSVCLQDQGTWPYIQGRRGARLCNPTAAGGDSTGARRKYFFLPTTLLQCQRTSYPVQLAPEIYYSKSEVCSAPYGVWAQVWVCDWSPERKAVKRNVAVKTTLRV